MKKKILIVDDDRALLTVLKDMVISLNYTVVEAHNGEEALTIYKTEHPDLVLLDILMPKKDGFEVLEDIKILHESVVPIIILSNLSGDEDLKKGSALGATDYITKSNFTLKEIMEKISKAFKITTQ